MRFTRAVRVPLEERAVLVVERAEPLRVQLREIRRMRRCWLSARSTSSAEVVVAVRERQARRFMREQAVEDRRRSCACGIARCAREHEGAVAEERRRPCVQQLLHAGAIVRDRHDSWRRPADFWRRLSSHFSDVVPETTAKVCPSSTLAAGEPRHTGVRRRAFGERFAQRRSGASASQHDRAIAARRRPESRTRRPAPAPASR